MEIIRKIIVGQNPKDAMAYFIGQKSGESEVDCIILDDRLLQKRNIRRYLVYIKHPEDGIMLWKSIENMPLLIEYDCNFK